MGITKKEYNEILRGVYNRAAINQELDEFIEGLPCYRLSELKKMLAKERLNYFLSEKEIYNKKAKAIDIEFTNRLLNGIITEAK